MWPKKSEYSLKSEHWPTIVINYADINTFNVLSKKLSLQTLLPPTIYYLSTCCGVNWNSIQPWSRRGDSGLYLTFNLVTHFNPVHFTYWQSVLPQPSTLHRIQFLLVLLFRGSTSNKTITHCSVSKLYITVSQSTEHRLIKNSSDSHLKGNLDFLSEWTYINDIFRAFNLGVDYWGHR